jgi:hypothetical protein
MRWEAIAFCARKIGVGSREEVIDLLSQNDRPACEYCRYGVAKQVAASLGSMDESVRAIYVLDYDATPQDLCFGTPNQGVSLVHLIVWVRRKTAALSSLTVALDRSLARAYADLIGRSHVKSLLDVQVVDDADVEHRTGHGALLGAIHYQPIQIWER